MARIFLGLWLVYGLLIDEYDLRRYTLPPAVIEALVERGTLDVTGSESFMAPDDPRSAMGGKHVIGDYFVHEHRILAAKPSYDDHTPETVHERFYRAVHQHDYEYCRGYEGARSSPSGRS